MVEGIQEYQQIGENLWKEWYCTAFQKWHSATAKGDDQTTNRETKNVVAPGLMTKAYKNLGDDVP
jgi:hypothetical protein